MATRSKNKGKSKPPRAVLPKMPTNWGKDWARRELDRPRVMAILSVKS